MFSDLTFLIYFAQQSGNIFPTKLSITRSKETRHAARPLGYRQQVRQFVPDGDEKTHAFQEKQWARARHALIYTEPVHVVKLCV